jgi:hypothetical protein
MEGIKSWKLRWSKMYSDAKVTANAIEIAEISDDSDMIEAKIGGFDCGRLAAYRREIAIRCNGIRWVQDEPIATHHFPVRILFDAPLVVTLVGSIIASSFSPDEIESPQDIWIDIR